MSFTSGSNARMMVGTSTRSLVGDSTRFSRAHHNDRWMVFLRANSLVRGYFPIRAASKQYYTPRLFSMPALMASADPRSPSPTSGPTACQRIAPARPGRLAAAAVGLGPWSCLGEVRLRRTGNRGVQDAPAYQNRGFW